VACFELSPEKQLSKLSMMGCPTRLSTPSVDFRVAIKGPPQRLLVAQPILNVGCDTLGPLFVRTRPVRLTSGVVPSPVREPGKNGCIHTRENTEDVLTSSSSGNPNAWTSEEAWILNNDMLKDWKKADSLDSGVGSSPFRDGDETAGAPGHQYALPSARERHTGSKATSRLTDGAFRDVGLLPSRREEFARNLTDAKAGSWTISTTNPRLSIGKCRLIEPGWINPPKHSVKSIHASVTDALTRFTHSRKVPGNVKADDNDRTRDSCVSSC